MSTREKYSRRGKMMSNENALAHKTRSSIHDMIVDRPGLTFTEIMKNLKIKESTLRYHIRYLQKKDIVKMKEMNGRKIYYSTIEGSVKDHQKELSKFQLKVLQIIGNSPGLVQKQLISRIKVNRFIGSYHIRRLMDMGLIRREKVGKNVRYFRISRKELKKRILLELVDDLLDGDIDEERYIELKRELEKLE